jgi:glycosyltransferase involved in cell wall biosynthesis
MNQTSAAAAPVASIVIVIDYKAGDPHSLRELRATLQGLAAQDFREPVELLLVEPASGRPLPDDILGVMPGLRVVRTDGTTSYDFKNAGARAAASDFVVLLDADCTPHPNWFRSVIEHRKRHPRAAAISGRTMYKGQGLLPRILALLDRSYVESKSGGRCSAISNNNGAFRRDVLLEFPLDNAVGPFGSRPHADQIMAAGHELRFEPGMVAYHGYGGWPMEQENREHTGFAMTRYRQLKPDASYAWLVRLGYAGIPVVVGMSILDSWRRCFKYASGYGLRWFEIPLACMAAVPAHLMEIKGIVLAMRGGWIGTSQAAFR